MAAAAAAAIAAEAIIAANPDVDQMLTMCGFTEFLERARLIDHERFASLDAFGDYTDSMIESMATQNEKRATAQRVRFGIQRILYVKAVAYWVRKQRREGIAVSIDDLNPDVLLTMVREMNLDRLDLETEVDDRLLQPGKFDPRRYVQWERSFANYLDSIRGRSGVPLSYIIRPENVVVANAAYDYERALWSAPHNGPAYRDDNRQVYRIYRGLMIGTDGWTWFNRADNGNGRQAHLLITQHYRGDAETALRAAEAESMLLRLFYRNEAAFSFENYITRMSECFELMKDNEQGLSEGQKVKKMLDGVVSTNAEVVAIKAVVRSTYPNDFSAASTLMAGQIALLFPAATNELRNKRKISAVNAGPGTPNLGRGRGGRGGGGRGGGGRHGNAHMLNGVDVSDPMRNFTSDEWKRLRESGFLSWLIDRRTALANRRGANPGRHAEGHGFHRGGRGPGRGDECGRRVQAVTFNLPQSDANSTWSETNVSPTSSLRGSANSGRAGVRFGGQRYGRAIN
jgi:hypothetical protein